MVSLSINERFASDLTALSKASAFVGVSGANVTS
jgi:hypothetical protein